MKKILFLLNLTLTSSTLFAYHIAESDTTDKSIFGNAAIPAKMLSAKHEWNDNNMRGALIIYREVLELDPQNAQALYWIARCHYSLKSYDLAQEYLDKSLSIDPEIDKDVSFFQGQIYHRLSKLDKAMETYKAFIKDNEGKNTYETTHANQYLNECVFAKEMMNKPADVNITNLGTTINTRFDEYCPSITGNGELMVFTSRRSTTVGGEIDEGSDYKFFEDVYYSRKDRDGNWSKAFGVDGEVNTPTYDAVLSIAPDGSEMFIYKNNKNSQGDIFSSSYDRHEDSWRAPEKLPRPVNTSYFESSASITADGEKLYFVSEREGGYGQGDIYFSKKTNDGWGKPKNLGTVINTDLDEKFVFIHPNGKTLYFASNGHQCLGGYDIFKTEFLNGQWSIPVNLGYPINTVNEESTFSLTKDNKTMYIAAEYGDTYGERDIYSIDVSNYPLISAGYESSGYGTLILNLKDAEGKVLKGEELKITLKDTGRVIAIQKSDRAGMVRINLPSGQRYLVESTDKEGSSTVIELAPSANKSQLIKQDFVMK